MLVRPFLVAVTALAAAFVLPAHAANPQVEFDTTAGKLRVELYPDAAPKTVANFLDYVKAKHYDGTQFHRVIAGFMIQGGGFTPDFKQKATKAPIAIEAEQSSKAGLMNVPGTLAMARTGDPNSATAQFFINDCQCSSTGSAQRSRGQCSSSSRSRSSRWVPGWSS